MPYENAGLNPDVDNELLTKTLGALDHNIKAYESEQMNRELNAEKANLEE